MRYVTKAAWQHVDDYGDISLTASELIEQDNGPVDTGLLDVNGRRLYRVADRLPFGFVGKAPRHG